MKTLPILLLVGPSGSGKTTVANLLSLRNGWRQVASYTTREPRYPGEEGHTFITEEEFRILKNLVAYTEYNGHRYGATAQQIDDCQIYVVDIPGVKSLAQNYKGERDVRVIILDVSEDDRRHRMHDRGDSDAVIEERIETDRVAFANIAERMCLLVGDSRVVAFGNLNSFETVIAIENYLHTEGYEWETT